MLWGLDASNDNGELDWVAVAAAHRPSFAFFKATEGVAFQDPLFPAAWAAIRELGLARGAYHFAHPSQDARQQAGAFLGCVRSSGLLDADMLGLDLEDADGLPPDAVSAWAREFCQVVAAVARRPPLVYTFIDFAWAGNCTGLGGYPLWIADPSSAPGQPRVPAPWTRWAVHQYGQQGLDLDVAGYPDTEAMTAALGVPHVPVPAPRKEDDVPNFSPIALPVPGAVPLTPAVTLDLSSAGTYRAIGFSSDWSLAGQPQPSIRVAVHSVSKGFSQVVHDLLIPQSGKAVVHFDEPDVDYISVSRQNASPALVSAGT